MQIELKNIKHAAFSSEETPCYQASLYIDGVRVATVSNDGHGGADMVHPVGRNGGAREKIDAAEKWLAEQPAETVDLGDGSTCEIKQSLETKCHELLDDHLIRKDVQSLIKRRIAFTRPDKKGIFQCQAKLKPTAANIERVRRDRPQWQIINDMPIDKAVEIYKRARQ